jgi:hypothetical protein
VYGRIDGHTTDLYLQHCQVCTALLHARNAQTYLYNRFRFLHTAYIDSALRQHNNHLYPTYTALMNGNVRKVDSGEQLYSTARLGDRPLPNGLRIQKRNTAIVHKGPQTCQKIRDDVIAWPHGLDEPFFRELQYCEWQAQIDGMLGECACVHTSVFQHDWTSARACEQRPFSGTHVPVSWQLVPCALPTIFYRQNCSRARAHLLRYVK